jgi:dynactin-6
MSAQPAPARPAPENRRSSTAPKRTSILPKPSSIFLDTTVLIAQHAQITGTHPVTIGPNTVLHPHSKLSSAIAPVVLGEGCVVFERAKVGVGMGTEGDAESRRSSMAPARSSAHVRESMRSEGTVLGRNVVVDSGAVVEAAEVGDGSVVEVGAVLGRGSIIGKVCVLWLLSLVVGANISQYCTITASSVIPPYTRLPDYTVVFGGSQQRVDRTLQLRPEILDAKMAVHAKQLDMFKKLIPNNIAKWS